MEKENSKSNLMTEGKIWKNILFFSIPLILGNLLQQLYNTADSIIVGNFVGSKALAAVGSSTSLIYLLIAFSQGASVGAGVIVAQFLGAKDKKATQDAVHTAFFHPACSYVKYSFAIFVISTGSHGPRILLVSITACVI